MVTLLLSNLYRRLRSSTEQHHRLGHHHVGPHGSAFPAGRQRLRSNPDAERTIAADQVCVRHFAVAPQLILLSQIYRQCRAGNPGRVSGSRVPMTSALVQRHRSRAFTAPLPSASR